MSYSDHYAAETLGHSNPWLDITKREDMEPTSPRFAAEIAASAEAAASYREKYLNGWLEQLYATGGGN